MGPKKERKKKETKNLAQAVKVVNLKVIEKVLFNRKKRRRIEKPEQRRKKEELRRQRKKSKKKKDDKELDGEGVGEERGRAKANGKEKDIREFLERARSRSCKRSQTDYPCIKQRALDPKASEWLCCFLNLNGTNIEHCNP
ncbi:hypothetical protein ElyMa_003546300 [Elysia marginata]|uniref:Thyroglobulin type-1 domain-containing protein n=1 Tax=Elysia marginata TaxID=1093978 RepID=A0AAV4EJU2_9GAST|nr:hypothetical protein ElyMa_003546300 [Elysia marginata]